MRMHSLLLTVMKKKIYLLALTMSLACLAFGCGKKDKEETAGGKSIQADLVEFVNTELPAIKSERETAISAYNSYFEAGSGDNQAFLDKLNNEIIPKLEQFVVDLTAIEVETEEVKELRGLYLKAAQSEYDAVQLVAKALAEENPDYMDEADMLIEESKSYIIQYESQLKILAIDNDVKINGSFTGTADENADSAVTEEGEETLPEGDGSITPVE